MATKKKTTDKIRESLIKLLKTTKNLDEITATALCDTAGINRATFYYHYNSVQDVFEEIYRNVEHEFADFLTHSTIGSDGTPEKSFYIKFFEFVARNADICRIIIKSGTGAFLSRALESGRYKVLGDMSKLFPACPTSKIDYYYVFVSNGFMGLLQYWLNNGMRESTREIAEIGEKIAYGGVAYLGGD